MGKRELKWDDIRKSLREWLDESGNVSLFKEKSLVRVEEIIKSKEVLTQEALMDLGSELESLSVYWGTLGLLSVLEGEERGWANIGLSWKLLCWVVALQILVVAGDEEEGEELFQSQAANCLLGALALKKDKTAEWLFQRMVEALKNNSFGEWDNYTLPPFALKLYGLWKGIAVDFSGYPAAEDLDMEEYGELFSSWEDPEKLKQAISQACEVHANEILYERSLEEFWTPFDLCPVEIIALYRIRKELGLPIPKVQHPLLASPLFQPPESIEEQPLQVLAGLVSRIKDSGFNLDLWPEELLKG